jgi:hypothetical protein
VSSLPLGLEVGRFFSLLVFAASNDSHSPWPLVSIFTTLMSSNFSTVLLYLPSAVSLSPFY